MLSIKYIQYILILLFIVLFAFFFFFFYITQRNLFFFFFSSRRRHTRSYGDWRSDVCSSDLVQPAGEGRRSHRGAHARGGSERRERPAPGRRDDPIGPARARGPPAAARTAPGVQGAGGTGPRSAAPPRRGAGGAGDGGGDGERGGPLTIARNALGIRPGRRVRGSRGPGC